MKKKILVIYNDRLLAGDLVRALNAFEFPVHYVDTGVKGIRILDNEYFDVVIIDSNALKIDGEDVAKYLRFKSSNRIPLIIGLVENSNSIKDNEFDRAYLSPLSMNDFAEILNCCANVINVDMKKDAMVGSLRSHIF